MLYLFIYLLKGSSRRTRSVIDHSSEHRRCGSDRCPRSRSRRAAEGFRGSSWERDVRRNQEIRRPESPPTEKVEGWGGVC